MSYSAVNPIWRTIRDRFSKTVQGLTDAELALKLSEDTPTIGYMIRHNAEVEYMFADWFFGKKKPEGIVYYTAGGPGKEKVSFTNLAELIAFSEESDRFLSQAMEELPESAWDVQVNSPIGPSTPRVALGRTLYHTGIHAGQISFIRKLAPKPETV